MGINEIWRKHVGFHPLFGSFGHPLHFAVNYGVTVIRRLQLTNFLGTTYGAVLRNGLGRCCDFGWCSLFFPIIPGIPKI